jgi:Tol biopolymer transport system component
MYKRLLCFSGSVLMSLCLLASAQEAPTGSAVAPNKDEQKALDGLKGKINGKICWSTSRVNSKHDIWIMNADGTDQKAVTNTSGNVDWFPRFSPDGSTILFCRSKSGWVAENDAEMNGKWDLWTVKPDGTDEKKVADDAVWGTWRPTGDSIVFARASKVFVKSLATNTETEIFDAEKQFKKSTWAQEPEMSPNGKFLAITLRGTSRQTGIWNFEKKEWYTTGAGCEITWFPDNKAVLRMNEGQGNGSTEILKFDVDENGKPISVPSGLSIDKKFRFMDLPGRRSHEYFPTISPDGQWMVWCATIYGQEHDIYDYEVYVWKIDTPQKDAVRLTFNTGNDRWPDIHLEK